MQTVLEYGSKHSIHIPHQPLQTVIMVLKPCPLRDTVVGHGGDGLGFVLVILKVFPDSCASMTACFYESSIIAASRSGWRSAAPMRCARH